MKKFGARRRWTRREDVRLLQGQGTFVENTAPPDALYAHFFRSPVAHAKITKLDLSEAREMQGVHLVLAAADLHAAGIVDGLPFEVLVCPDGSTGAAPRRPLLAEDKVRFVGEPLAVVIAETPHIAKDACEQVEFEYEEISAHTRLSEGGPPLHAEVPDNCAFHWSKGDISACQAAFERAAHKVSRSVRNNRITVNSIEPRGCYALPSDGRLHVAVNGQGVDSTRDSLSQILGLAPETIRVTTPDVGGGFGMKAMSYPEPILVAYAAHELQRAVRWMSERIEAMQTDAGARDLEHLAEMAFDENYRLIGYRVDTACNLGAYNSDLGQLIQTDYFAMVLTGAYHVQNCALNVKGIYTNSAQTDAYRGAGRAEASYLLERMMDYAANDLGVDPWELRRRNFIQPGQFPYSTAMGEQYDPADYEKVLNRAASIADIDGFERRKAASGSQGRLRGIGLSYYIMNAIGSSKVSTRLDFLEDEKIKLTVPSQSAGQGHESVFTMFLADHSGLPEDRISIEQGDSDRVGIGVGTGGSSSATTVGNATLVTVANTVEAFRPVLAEAMGVDPQEIEFDGETFRAPGSNLTPSLLDAAEMIRAAGRLDLLSVEGVGEIDTWAFPNGAHVAEVEVDPETGSVTLDRYTVVSDFGNLLNPVLVEGQVHGGCAQGIGQALIENTAFDEDGQLLTASFMDYAMPRATDFPAFDYCNEPVPSSANPLGVKGCGEAGTVGAIAAAANAVADALRGHETKQIDIPLTPGRIWALVQGRADKH
ncbi:xanthine dehydrogenase family protein molybdopterin-binding subunit [Primorskyibacter sp. S87]|uniref:xanthine dehydrogenase family protein molybdopterin-binding subunit n=1 Tax=Primorskyibacter sp. S87 TaxID=3415126 RepID=UPI003C7B98D7